eukprot:3113161-Rhodomonas_salina.2
MSSVRWGIVRGAGRKVLVEETNSSPLATLKSMLGQGPLWLSLSDSTSILLLGCSCQCCSGMLHRLSLWRRVATLPSGVAFCVHELSRARVSRCVGFYCNLNLNVSQCYCDPWMALEGRA